MLAVEAGWKYSVKVEYDAREEVTEVHGAIFLHTRESRHPDKYGRIVCL